MCFFQSTERSPTPRCRPSPPTPQAQPAPRLPPEVSAERLEVMLVQLQDWRDKYYECIVPRQVGHCGEGGGCVEVEHAGPATGLARQVLGVHRAVQGGQLCQRNTALQALAAASCCCYCCWPFTWTHPVLCNPRFAGMQPAACPLRSAVMPTRHRPCSFESKRCRRSHGRPTVLQAFDAKELGEWVHRVRRLRAQGRLPEDVVSRLDEASVCFEVPAAWPGLSQHAGCGE